VYSSPDAVKNIRDVGTVTNFSARPADYLRAHHRSALYGSRMPAVRASERGLFPGAAPLAFAAAALVPPISLGAATYAVASLVSFEGSLGFNGWLHPLLYRLVPPLQRLRVPARFSIMVGLSLAVLAGFGVRRLLHAFGRTRWRQRLLFAAIVTAAVIDARPTLRLEAVWKEPPTIYASIAGTPGVVLAEFPVPSVPESFVENTPFMYFSLWHWAPMVNGYSGLIPPRFAELVRNVRGFPAPQTVAFLHERGISHVSVNCALFRSPCPPVVDGIDRSGAFRRIVHATWQGDSVYLYELIR
jgi:hypothetical protein